MKPDTKTYSDFLRRNDINTRGTIFEFGNDTVEIYKDGKMWYYDIEGKGIIQQGGFISKKSALYFCIKDNYNNIYS